MNEQALKLFLENYENKGFCEKLPSFQKKIEKEFKKSGVKKTIHYLPWAVVERLFRMQGGKIEVVDWNYKVEFSSIGVDGMTGEIVETKETSSFIKLHGHWQGEELVEYYPIFDSQTARVVRTPDSQQLNSSRQRGSVRLIARLSGIGLWIFEQQEDSDEDDSNTTVILEQANEKTPQKTSKTKVVKGETQKEAVELTKEVSVNKKEEIQKQKDDAMLGVLDASVEEEEIKEEQVVDVLLGNIISPTTKETKTSTPSSPEVKAPKTYDNESEEHADLLLKVKGFVKEHKDTILNFRNEKGKQVLSQLTYDELKELISILEK